MKSAGEGKINEGLNEKQLLLYLLLYCSYHFGPNVANLRGQYINTSYLSYKFDYTKSNLVIFCSMYSHLAMFKFCQYKVYKALMNKKGMFQMR